MSSIGQLSKKVEEQKSEIHRLRSIIENLPGSIYWKDKNGVYLGQNIFAAEKMKSVNLEPNMIGKTDYDLFLKEAADMFRKHDMEVMQSKKTLAIEETTFLTSGKKVIQISVKKPLLGENGEVAGVMGTTIDITDLKELEVELRAAKEIAEVANTRIKAMAGSIAHELRTPLGAIGMNLGCVESAYSDLPAETREIVEGSCQEIRKELESANTIINMLLMNIREQMDLAKDKLETCSMNHCIEEALRRYPFSDDQKEKVAWKKSNDFTFQGNAIFIQHVIFNLLKNALHQITKVGKGGITIWAEQESDGFAVHFKDTASGVPKDILSHMFERFFSRTKGGTGLGLAFCKMVIEAFGGTISCQSEEGKYTEFIVHLPEPK